jgi:N-acetylglucosamine-6-phosphate deacetylase
VSDPSEVRCRRYDDAGAVTVRFSSGRAAVTDDDRPGDPDGLILAPLLLDLQLNGYGGTDFSRAETLTPERVRRLTRTMWAHGVGRFVPTIVTSSHDATRASLRALAAAAVDADLAGSIVGVHLEGPVISPHDGPRGAHPLEHVRAPSVQEFDAWQEAARGLVRIVTLAPEVPGAIAFIGELRARGVLVAIGHTDASAADIAAAVRAGARLSTHLGNGTHARLPRHPNHLWDQLADDALSASLIVDGFHLDAPVVKVMVRAKGAERCVLITDAAPVAGLPPGRYTFAGAEVESTVDGAIRLSGTPYLAGSAVTLPRAIANTVRFAGVGLASAIDMASTQPARLLAQYTQTAPCLLGDDTFTLLRPRGDALEVTATVIDGIVRHRAPGT